MSLVACHMQWCPPVWVALIQECLGKLGLLLSQQVVARLIIALLCVDPDVAEQSSLLFLVLLTLWLHASGSLTLLCCQLVLYRKKGIVKDQSWWTEMTFVYLRISSDEVSSQDPFTKTRSSICEESGQNEDFSHLKLDFQAKSLIASIQLESHIEFWLLKKVFLIWQERLNKQSQEKACSVLTYFSLLMCSRWCLRCRYVAHFIVRCPS